MNFFQSLWGALKGPLGQLGSEELKVLSPAIGQAVTGMIADPSRKGLVSNGMQAVAAVAVVQPNMVGELIADLTAAIESAIVEETAAGAAPAPTASKTTTVATPTPASVASAPLA